jgi:hypothetical protein
LTDGIIAGFTTELTLNKTKKILTTSNLDRAINNIEGAKLYGQRKGCVVIRWFCKMKKGIPLFIQSVLHVQESYPEL